MRTNGNKYIHYYFSNESECKLEKILIEKMDPNKSNGRNYKVGIEQGMATK